MINTMLEFISIFVPFFVIFFVLLGYWNYFIFTKFNPKVKKIIPNFKIWELTASDPSRMFKMAPKVWKLFITLKIFSKIPREELADEVLNLKEVKKLNNLELNKDIQKIYFLFKLNLLFVIAFFILILITIFF